MLLALLTIMLAPNIPTEILYEIAQRLDSERDLSALTRSCRLLYLLLTNLLYSNNVHHHGSAALFWAAKKGRSQTAQRMIDAGSDLRNIRDHHRQTPLHYAALFGHKPVIEVLVDNGAEPTSFDWSGMSPLHYAVRQSHADIAEFLLSKRNQFRSTSIGNVPLYASSRCSGTWSRCHGQAIAQPRG